MKTLTPEYLSRVFSVACAAAKHYTGIDAKPMLLLKKQLKQNNAIHSRINNVICYHLISDMKFLTREVAKAYGVSTGAIKNRQHTGYRMIEFNPWKQVLESIRENAIGHPTGEKGNENE
jgi:hypothetical protein